MNGSRACASLEPDLIATATGEASADVIERVRRHLEHCRACRDEEAQYRAVETAATALKKIPVPPAEAARERLLATLSDLRARLVRYGVFRTSLGPLLIAATEQGIALVEYVGRADGEDSWLLRQRRIESQADPVSVERFHAELTDYLAGRRTRLDWPLDFRFVRSDFQREVLRVTAQLPYGAVSSYAGIAHQIGRPKAVRAVAGALRRNPVPIVVPCHRIVGSGGALVGYSGTRIDLKEQLLSIEGVRMEHAGGTTGIDRSSMYAWYRGYDSYCLPTCGSISAQPIGTVTLFSSAGEAAALGLAPCGDCRPDLHPLDGAASPPAPGSE